jgi:hypothetical protein
MNDGEDRKSNCCSFAYTSTLQQLSECNSEMVWNGLRDSNCISNERMGLYTFST